MLKAGNIKLQAPKPKDLHVCLKMIADEKTGFIATTDLIAKAKLSADYGKENPFTITDAGTELLLHVIVSKANPVAASFVADFNRALAQMKKSGEVTKFVDHYFAGKPRAENFQSRHSSYNTTTDCLRIARCNGSPVPTGWRLWTKPFFLSEAEASIFCIYYQ